MQWGCLLLILSKISLRPCFNVLSQKVNVTFHKLFIVLGSYEYVEGMEEKKCEWLFSHVDIF